MRKVTRPSVPVSFGYLAENGTFNVTFAIPTGAVAAFGIWNTVGSVTGTNDGHTYNARVTTGASHNADFAGSAAIGGIVPSTNSKVPGIYQPVALYATANQLTDINTAAGGNLTVTYKFVKAIAGNYQYTAQSFTLTLLPEPGSHADPMTLTGTSIIAIDTSAKALAARVHCHADGQQNLTELWFYRDATWQLCPQQPRVGPDSHIVINRQYRQPSTLSLTLDDNDGLLTPQNKASALNQNMSAAYDPLLDATRKILLRAGTLCYTNLANGIAPTCNAVPTSGTLSQLTDGQLSPEPIAASRMVQLPASGTTPIILAIDFGSPQEIQHAVIRFGTWTGNCLLPSSVFVEYSQNGGAWFSAKPTRPVGGTNGDWADDYFGRVIEIDTCNIETTARYIRWTFVPQSAPIWIDEVAVYGGAGAGYYGRNVFCGYLGDSVDLRTIGQIDIQATDVSKKLADNNEAELTARFANAEVGDMVWSILTGSAYWHGSGTAYDAPLTDADLAWTLGANLTGLIFPLWQGQSNNILGYSQDLFHELGWFLLGDGDGVWFPLEPVYNQRLPDRVCIAHGDDGNGDVRNCVRHYGDKDLRNVVKIESAAADTTAAAGLYTDPPSIKRWGRRRMRVTDPIATGQAIRQKIADSILRDYAWRVGTLQTEIRPDFDTTLKQIFGFRCEARPYLYALANSVRLGELWSLDRMEEHISAGDWWGHCDWVPYVCGGPDPPQNIVITTTMGQISISWDPIVDPHVTGVNAYISTVSESTGFLPASGNPYSITPPAVITVTNGIPIWVYLTTIDDQGQESVSSTIHEILVGATGAQDSDWAVTDLGAAFNPPVVGPGPRGKYTYEFLLTWTAPPAGYKRSNFYYSVGSLPANPDDPNQWAYQDEWHGEWSAPGNSESWYPRILGNPTIASGTHVYWRILTSDKNTTDNGLWVWSNIALVTMP